MTNSSSRDVPRRRELFGSGALAAVVFIGAFGLLQVTGSEWALVLLLPALLLVVRTLVGIRRRQDAGGRGSGESSDRSHP